jgi:hypothetical protein
VNPLTHLWPQALLVFAHTFLMGILLGAIILAATSWLHSQDAIDFSCFRTVAALWLSGQVAVFVRHLLPSLSNS